MDWQWAVVIAAAAGAAWYLLRRGSGGDGGCGNCGKAGGSAGA